MTAVIHAYRTDHYPLDGNLPEVVLVLDDGRAVYLNPGLADEIYDTLDEALDRCEGTPEESASLFIAWQAGYDTSSLVDLINEELERFDLAAGDLDAYPVSDGTTPEPHLVALADLQETTVCHALPVLRALEALPDGASWEDIWHVVTPHIVAE